jgi:hypothetical protein
VYADESRIVVEEYAAPCSIPADRKLKHFRSLKEFQQEYAYGSIEGYYITYVSDDAYMDHLTEEDILFPYENEMRDDFALQEQ